MEHSIGLDLAQDALHAVARRAFSVCLLRYRDQRDEETVFGIDPFDTARPTRW